MSNTRINTWSGRIVDLADPKPEDICIEDIAHALARICRFAGHTDRFCSVAAHSLAVEQEVNVRWPAGAEDGDVQAPTVFALAALLHDAAEAYVGDVSRPLKALLRQRPVELAGRPTYEQVEWRVQAAIAERFGFAPDLFFLPAIKDADLAILHEESRTLMSRSTLVVDRRPERPASVGIRVLDPEAGEALFLRRFQDLAARRIREQTPTTKGKEA